MESRDERVGRVMGGLFERRQGGVCRRDDLTNGLEEGVVGGAFWRRCRFLCHCGEIESETKLCYL